MVKSCGATGVVARCWGTRCPRSSFPELFVNVTRRGDGDEEPGQTRRQEVRPGDGGICDGSGWPPASSGHPLAGGATTTATGSARRRAGSR